MGNAVKSFKELTPELWAFAGGKGGMLARMFQDGYPVPEGFVILPSAFQGEKLNPEAWNETQASLHAIRKNHEGALFAVRSSALSEDSAQASFAGEFETVLNAKTDKEILEAIYTVHRSRQAERVKVYSSVQGMEPSHQIAVVIQLMVPSEISGVLFTADPITGSNTSMTGNFVHGLGEQLVSGEANAYPFTFMRPKGKYDGPEELKKYASKLYRLADRLETELGGPQDIEWAVAKGKLYILQARPITTLQPGNPDTYEWNDSLTGDFLWTNTNVGEAFSDVFTPLSWSVIRALDEEQKIIPGYYLFSGNICGRAYTNLSFALSLYPAFGLDIKRGFKAVSEVFGQIPTDMSVPIYPFSRLGLIKAMAPHMRHRLKRLLEAFKVLPQHVKETPEWCRKMTAHIRNVNSKEELLSLWKNELLPYNFKALWVALAGARKITILYKLKEELFKLVGTEDTNTLLSNFRGNAALESLGPVVGIAKIIKGEMSRGEYLMRYGHRGPHEFELSVPHPGEDADWLEKQIEEFKKSDVDVEGLLKKNHAQYEEAWKRFEARYPEKARRIGKKLAKVGEAARLREAVRSEWTRVFRLNRAFALRAGELTEIGDDVFFLYIDEVLNLLSGDDSAVKHIPARKETYNKYKSLPPFPSIIRGRFDPFKWAEDPNRRADYYDATMPVVVPDSDTLKGFPGAAGRVEGTVRVLVGPEEGEQLQPGEILVASTTNVGWTPLFPKAAAIITDIGAPLSHAAIVARELGIPAVVGCGNATTRLKTGDRVIVDGGQGVVHILN
ncbi:PEP/pyruvate-binding domain-containing protein [Laceyella putida]|uniref:PEP/pyruvate-binding domain-containing protein n=1 Tax=Laceyella putida TaxID=110101 RepID=A0ABW2RFN7_9BACL